MTHILASGHMNEEERKKMKLQLMFLLMDVLMLLACGYLWLRTFFLRAMRWHLKLPNHD